MGQKLALRSVNSSRSAYAYVFFSSMFFQHYCWAAVPQPHQKEKQLSPPCKLIIKSVLPVFRCVNMLERNVEKCSIYTDINDHHITFQLLCKHGVVKTYNLTFQECDPLQAVFAKHMCPNVLKLHSRLLADIMVHFPSSQEEVTLSVTPMKVCFKSYTEEDTDFSKTMLTEIQLNPDEFDYFQVGVDSEVTFCLKELRVKDSWCFQKPPVFLSPSILTSLESQLLSALKIWCWKPALSWLPCLTLTRRLPSINHPALHHGRKGNGGLQGWEREDGKLKFKRSSQAGFRIKRNQLILAGYWRLCSQNSELGRFRNTLAACAAIKQYKRAHSVLASALSPQGYCSRRGREGTC
ncbi:cell cycle checkpoint control protein RAD9B isoform X2 [Pezoporus wallicus]|uniref:cell cycle checkpoint control protein RAD9B isoform X2 n=1 Tax=Pezoporus wallicus TaxID=35540 RepID=UPI00254AA667|nr:cell cycle checkpoint control protein RAD9B isoform X2 [Pezoporus wallicus]XP_057277278.1 cell cycle checkpoint control protein RAD9B isoform X2 [Pezoporus wallicus]